MKGFALTLTAIGALLVFIQYTALRSGISVTEFVNLHTAYGRQMLLALLVWTLFFGRILAAEYQRRRQEIRSQSPVTS